MGLKDLDDKKVLDIAMGFYRILFWPAVLAHKKAEGNLTIRKELRNHDAHFEFKDSKIDEQYTGEELEPKRIDKASKENYQLFVKVLIENFSPECLVNLQRNIKGTAIDTELLYCVYNGAGSSGHVKTYEEDGQYWVEVENTKLLFHELFHLATCRRISPDLEFFGFEQIERREDGKIYSLGSGINEGYTELMAERYFPDKKNKWLAFPEQVSIVKKIEAIVGKEKMETFYMTSNPKGLFEELAKYISQEDVTDLFYICDYTLLESPGKNGVTKENVTHAMEDIDELLIRAFINKQTQRLNNHEIDEDEYRKEIDEFLQTFKVERECNGHLYEVHSPAVEDAYKVLNNPMLKH